MPCLQSFRSLKEVKLLTDERKSPADMNNPGISRFHMQNLGIVVLGNRGMWQFELRDVSAQSGRHGEED